MSVFARTPLVVEGQDGRPGRALGSSNRHGEPARLLARPRRATDGRRPRRHPAVGRGVAESHGRLKSLGLDRPAVDRLTPHAERVVVTGRERDAPAEVAAIRRSHSAVGAATDALGRCVLAFGADGFARPAGLSVCASNLIRVGDVAVNREMGGPCGGRPRRSAGGGESAA